MSSTVPATRYLKKHHPIMLGWDREKPLPEIFKVYPDLEKGRFVVSMDDDPLIFDGRLTVVDLFAGAGGFSLGFVQAGWRVIAAVEFDYWATVTYCRNIPGYQKAPLVMFKMPIQRVTGDLIREVTGVEHVNAVIGGPPCQGFSTSGKRQSGDKRDHMVYEFARLINEIRPDTFIMENVPGIRTKRDTDGRLVLDKFMEMLPLNLQQRSLDNFM